MERLHLSEKEILRFMGVTVDSAEEIVNGGTL